MYTLPERRGGGEVIWAMPERKHSFLHEVFPNTLIHGHVKVGQYLGRICNIDPVWGHSQVEGKDARKVK